MNSPSLLTHTLHLLRAALPPQALIHVGAGRGQGELHQWHDWPIEQVLCIDADESKLAHWQDKRNARGWHSTCVLLAEEVGERTYHHASNPDESGLLPPAELKALWPSLRELKREQRPASTLDQLLDETLYPALHDQAPLWLIIDCLPAAAILQGAGKLLKRADVVILRSLEAEPGTATQPSQLQAEASGLHAAGFIESNHPQVGHTVYLRNLAQREKEAQAQTHAQQNQLLELAQRYDTQVRLATERLQNLEKITVDRENEQKAATEQQQALQNQIQALKQQASELQQQLHHQQQLAQQLSQERNVQAQLATERQQYLGKITVDLENVQKTATEQQQALQNQIQALTQQASELQQQLQHQQQLVQQLCQERDAQAHLAAERLQNLEKITVDRDSEQKTATEQQQALQTQLHTLTQQANELQQQLQHQQQLAQQLSQERDTQAQLATEHQQNLEKITVDRENEQKAAAEQRQAQEQAMQGLQQRIKELEQQNQQLAQACDAAQQQVNAQAEQLQNQAAQHQELQYRQQLMQEEMIKAEAQIELIKDLLLREPGL